MATKGTKTQFVPFVLFVVRQPFSAGRSPADVAEPSRLVALRRSSCDFVDHSFLGLFQDGVAYKTPTNCRVVIMASRVKKVPAAASPMRMNQPGFRASGSRVRLTNRVWKQLKPRA